MVTTTLHMSDSFFVMMGFKESAMSSGMRVPEECTTKY
jgi:hypothetical protein